jgi:hypothetical protein
MDYQEIQNAKKAIIQTIIYSDIFDFPMKEQELWYFLKSTESIAKEHFIKALATIPAITSKSGYYVLKNRMSIVQKRKNRGKISERKLILAKKAARILSYIPSILFIGVSGSLALRNTEEYDDIDFFIITEEGTIWSTRFFTLILLHVLGIRRKKYSRATKDIVCLNMIIEKKAVAFPRPKQDTYIAHEIAQLMPLINKRQTYEYFLVANRWLHAYLPNVITPPNNLPRYEKEYRSFLHTIVNVLAIESLLKKIQLFSINRTKTTETISNNFLAFHPHDNRKRILDVYNHRLKKAHYRV